MAEENKKRDQKLNTLDDITKKSNLSVFGTSKELEKDSDSLKNIIKQTMIATSEKYGDRANGKVINYFNELNFASAFAEFKNNGKLTKDEKENPQRAFKEYMSKQDFGNISSILMAESGRIISYSNYKAIYNHIPECAQALDTYKDNIMSPDDFTKLIFNIDYDNELDKEIKEKVESQLDDIRVKYEIDDIADEIIGEALMFGDQYLAVLSLEEELSSMLNDPMNTFGKQSLNEEVLKSFDLSVVNIEVNKSDVEKSKVLTETFHEAFHVKNQEEKSSLTEEVIQEMVADLINKNIKIGSKKEFLMERISAEQNKEEMKINNSDIFQTLDKKKKKTKKDDNKPLYINGSSLRLLDPSKVVELKIDNVIYGYYYVEDAHIGNIPNAGYLGQSTGREVLNPVTMGSNIITTNNSKFTPSMNNLSSIGLGDQKVNIISKVFLDVLSKKINKDFVRHNKEFKDFIYNLVKQDYILKKEVKMTYFSPDEVIAFKVPALYRKVVFFAKLYLAMLTNMMLMKMGRAHDKRIFYVDVGADANYEQAISRVVQDIKTKEFKMDNLGEINTILNLTPGRFDDYYIPTINGEEPIKIETLPGMDVDMNNDFLEFLRDSMMSGIGIPRSLIDATKEVDFARTLSAQNANFVRNVIKYQKKFTLPFTKLFRKLYENEYKYSNDQKSEVLSLIDITDIKVSFPSPATLNMSNITDQIQVAESNSEFISSQLITPDPTGLSDGARLKLKSEIVKDLLPGINWEKYEKLKDKIELENVGEVVKANIRQEQEQKRQMMMGNDQMNMPE
jgi:hypothetical protein